MKFYVCKHCGNIIAYAKNKGVPVMCCGEKMSELVPGSVDAATEKHVPVISVEGNKVTVTVGEVEHPMAEEHFIEWIALETQEGNQRKELKPGSKPLRIAAVSARVALPCGSSMLLLLPLIRLSALAHCIASTAQDETLSASLKLSSLLDLEVS